MNIISIIFSILMSAPNAQAQGAISPGYAIYCGGCSEAADRTNKACDEVVVSLSFEIQENGHPVPYVKIQHSKSDGFGEDGTGFKTLALPTRYYTKDQQHVFEGQKMGHPGTVKVALEAPRSLAGCSNENPCKGRVQFMADFGSPKTDIEVSCGHYLKM